MPRPNRLFVAALAGLIGLASGCRRPPPPASSAPLTAEVYLWQRAHTPTVAVALADHAAAFDRIAVLAAELAWPAGRAHVTRVALDPETLRPLPSLALVIRVQPRHGSFAPDDPATRALLDTCRATLAEARRAGLAPAEIQIDFDSAESQLADFRRWLLALRPVVAPARLTFTALPAWLDHRRAFADLAHAADGFVLQVHSLARPASFDDSTPLCDPAAARRAIDLAASAGVPFRVALPTYGYQLAFGPDGRFLGASAEGPARAWPAGTRLRALRADPATLAPLVAALATRHPAVLTGLIWYRLPIAGDRLNWRWPTLAAVMAGRVPKPRIQLETAPASAPGLVDLRLVNAGDADFSGPFSAGLTWTGARRLAADALPPLVFAGDRDSSLRLSAAALDLPAGESRPAGWLRLDAPPLSFHVSLTP